METSQENRLLTVIIVTVILFFLFLVSLLLGMWGDFSPRLKDRLFDVGATGVVTLALVLFTEFCFKKSLPQAQRDREKEQKTATTREREVLQVENAQTIPRTPDGIVIYKTFADINLADFVRQAKRIVRFFAVSGRHLFVDPRMREIISNKLLDPKDRCRFEILVIDTTRAGNFVTARDNMMALSIPHHDYKADIINAREFLKGITSHDPERAGIDVRFYSLLPTTFFFIIDDTLFVSFLLTNPVATCPVCEVDMVRHPDIATRFAEHFSHYWERSKYFASILGFEKKTGKTLMVLNKKRGGWEWPSGYIEPGETSLQTAEREFLEETGFTISTIYPVDETYSGIYYCGLIGEQVQAKNNREIKKIALFKGLPKNLAFAGNRPFLQAVAHKAKKIMKEYVEGST